MLGGELAVVSSGGLPGSQIVSDQSGEQLLGLDERDLHVAVGVALQKQLLLDALGQNGEHVHGLLGKTRLDEGVLLLPSGQGVELGGLLAGQQFVDFRDQHGEFGNELHDALGDDGNAEVPALRRPGGHGVGNIVRDLGEGHLLLSHFLANQADVGLGFQGAFQRHVGSGTTHDLDKVPILLGGVGVALDVADDLAVGLGSGVEAEGALDVLVLQVAVDGLGATNHLNAAIVGGKILGENRGVGVGVVAADDDDGGDAMLLADALGNGELLLGFQLGSAGADDVKSAGVAVLVDVFVVEDYVVVLQQAAGAALEAVEDVFLVAGLQRVVQTADDVVAAGRLTAGKDHAHDLLLRRGGVLTLLEGDLVFAVGIGEQRLDLFLIRDALGGAAAAHTNIRNPVSEHTRKLGTVLVSCYLERGQFHGCIHSLLNFVQRRLYSIFRQT